MRKVAQNHSIGTKFKLDRQLITMHSHTKNQVNISNHSEIKWLTLIFQEKIPGGVGTPSIIWGTTTRILIIFLGVPPHKYKYLK
jgi:hypothetical protein